MENEQEQEWDLSPTVEAAVDVDDATDEVDDEELSRITKEEAELLLDGIDKMSTRIAALEKELAEAKSAEPKRQAKTSRDTPASVPKNERAGPSEEEPSGIMSSLKKAAISTMIPMVVVAGIGGVVAPLFRGLATSYVSAMVPNTYQTQSQQSQQRSAPPPPVQQPNRQTDTAISLDQLQQMEQRSHAQNNRFNGRY